MSSIEQIYQKKTQLEHILLRPDTYIGSVESETEFYWIIDHLPVAIKTEEKQQSQQNVVVAKFAYTVENIYMTYKKISIVPGLFKIFDEILINASDNKQRDKENMTHLKVNIDAEKGMIQVWNDGAGIPVVMHKDHDVYVPELIFGHLLTSSNYNDTEKKTTGGRNGYGAKLANIFSNKFSVETYDSKSGLHYLQSWSNNMTEKSVPIVKSMKSENKKDFTCITFYPDLAKFGMKEIDQDTLGLFYKRVFDIAGTSDKTLKVSLNGIQIKIKKFQEYIELYMKPRLSGGCVKKEDENNTSAGVLPPTFIYDQPDPRWEIAVTLNNEHKFQQISFVNNICTSKGGTHVNYISDQICSAISEHIAKKHKEESKLIKPALIKNYLFLFINALIENPTFDSQTKVNLTSKKQNFGSSCELSEKFIKKIINSGIVENILKWTTFKQGKELKKQDGKKSRRIEGLPKLEDANCAGTKQGHLATLILTEGDSAKALAVSGLSVVGRDYYGVFPLKGKLLNVRDASHKQIMENTEIAAIIKILGLQHQKVYTDCRELRYGHIMIMADQDQLSKQKQ